MRFRNALRLVGNNFANVYKLLLFRLVTGIVFFSLIYLVVSLGMHVIFSSEEAQYIVTLLGDFFKSIVSGDTAFLSTFSDKFTEAVTAFLRLLGTQRGSIVGSVIGIALLYLLARFVNGTAVFAFGTILNDKMEFYGNTRFSSAYFKNIGNAALYHVIYVPLTFVYDLLCLLACWFFFLYTPSLLSSWGVVTILIGLSLSMAAFIGLQALKLTFISAWIPAVVSEGEGVAAGFRRSIRSVKNFGGRFSTFFVASYLIVVINVLFALCTFGSAALLTIPASYLLLLALQFVHFYEDTGKKYFISFRKISGADGKPEGMGN